MSTLSVPLTARLEEYIDGLVRCGKATNKADAVRRALLRQAEEDAIMDILQSKKEIKEGKVVYGNLRTIIKKIS
ncbi:MAG: hypothetical protein NUV81_01415 [bacterium]|nr:hypothetical protein [bacterium]